MDPAILAALDHGTRIDLTTTGRHSGEPRTIEIVYHNVDGRIVISGSPVAAPPRLALQHRRGPGDHDPLQGTGRPRRRRRDGPRGHGPGRPAPPAGGRRPQLESHGRRRDDGAEPPDRDRRARLQVGAGFALHRVRLTLRRPRVATGTRGVLAGGGLPGVDGVAVELALRGLVLRGWMSSGRGSFSRTWGMRDLLERLRRADPRRRALRRRAPLAAPRPCSRVAVRRAPRPGGPAAAPATPASPRRSGSPPRGR